MKFLRVLSFFPLIALAAQANALEMIDHQVIVDRDALHEGRPHVRNSIRVVITKETWAEYELSLQPFFCGARQDLAHRELKMTVDLLPQGGVRLLATDSYEISGNNGFVEFHEYLCAYSRDTGMLIDALVLGKAEYFEND